MKFAARIFMRLYLADSLREFSKKLITSSIRFSDLFRLISAAFQRKRVATRPTPWTLNRRRQLFAIISRVRPVEERSTATGGIVGMRRSASRVSTSARTGTGTSTGIAGMWESLWKGPSVWKAPRGIAREWSD